MNKEEEPSEAPLCLWERQARRITVCRQQTFNEGQFALLILQRRKPFDKKSISHDIKSLLFITRKISCPNSFKYAASQLRAQISAVSHSLMATCKTYAQNHPGDRAGRLTPRGWMF